MNKLSIIVAMALWALAMPAWGNAKDIAAASGKDRAEYSTTAGSEMTVPGDRDRRINRISGDARVMPAGKNRTVMPVAMTPGPRNDLTLLCQDKSRLNMTMRLNASAQYHCWHRRCVCVSPNQSKMCIAVRKTNNSDSEQTTRLVLERC
jgi:hypothetical protein